MTASGKTTARYGARRFAGAGMLLAIALASLLGACDDGPPTRPSPPPSAPPGPVTITRLELAGPDSLPPGATAQYSAIAHQSDGTTRDVTSSALWRTGNPSVLSISSSTGLATAHARGETVVTTNAGGQFALKPDVIVVPAGTFRLGGIVKDGGVPVIGVRVEVTAGTGQGLATTTTSASPQTPFPNGAYRLYGVSGDTEVRVTRDGYQEQRKKFQVTSHQTLDFDLVLTRPRPMSLEPIPSRSSPPRSAPRFCPKPQEGGTTSPLSDRTERGSSSGSKARSSFPQVPRYSIASSGPSNRTA
jgi:hypothetical protein